MAVNRNSVVETAKATVREFRKDDLQGLAAEVAYHVLFSVIPLLIFLTALSSFISRAIGTDDAVQRVTSWLFTHLPASTADAVASPIRTILEREQPGLLSVGALLALWSAKNAVAALMKALNRTFNVEDRRSWLRRTLIAMGLTVALGLALVTASALLVAGHELGRLLADVLGLGNAWETVWALVRWPLVALALAVALAVLYWAGPDTAVPFSWLTPGSILAVALLAAATYSIGLYFRYAAGWAGPAYGALGGVLAFVFWLYVVSLVILLGGELNAVMASRQRAEALASSSPARTGAPQTPGDRRPGALDTRPQR